MQTLQVTQKVDVFFVNGGDAGVAARIETPALFLNFGATDDLTQATNVNVLAVGEVLGVHYCRQQSGCLRRDRVSRCWK